MKCQIPQISWHGRDPVLSVDFQPIQSDFYRLASGGTDAHVLIWYVTYQENNCVKIECASDLARHNKSVNVVRFSPNGEFLASGDDEGGMFIWRLKEREQIDAPKDDENVNKEEWYPVKSLRGHLEDIFDISWSKDSNFLVSASMDNTTIIWDMQKYVKLHIFSDFKGYVQGVSWDPCNQYIASLGTGRTLTIHNINSKKVSYRLGKAPWKNSTDKGTFKARLFHDDTLKSYCRRLSFTPDGELLIVPSGIVEKGEKVYSTTYIFSRHAPNKPVISLPTGDKYTVAVRCNPFLYKLRGDQSEGLDKENEKSRSLINLPYRMIFAVAACDAVLLYDTEQVLPFAYVSNIHYTHLSDLTWSPDGLTLVVSSTDGYCSFIIFSREELGEIYIPEEPKEADLNSEQVSEANEKMDVNEISDAVLPETEKDKVLESAIPLKGHINTKSPKVVSQIVKEESATPSSKSAKNSENKKSKKSPKMCSIKKFFISPKTANSATAAVKASEIQEKRSLTNINSVGNKKIEVITLLDTPEKNQKPNDNESAATENTNSKSSVSQSEDSKSLIRLINKEEEAMDVDSDIHEASDKVKESAKPTSKKEAKCKVRLDFTTEVEPVKNIDDNASDTNLNKSSSSNSIKNIDNAEVSKENENDWKLELSQDEGIVPMDTTPVDSERKTEIPKCSVSKEVSKRRISFITLSSKTSVQK